MIVVGSMKRILFLIDNELGGIQCKMQSTNTSKES
jgi:hypothetical protein